MFDSAIRKFDGFPKDRILHWQNQIHIGVNREVDWKWLKGDRYSGHINILTLVSVEYMIYF